jgi:acetyltransferase-like isoleucine patch superfamily enzyme
MTGARRLLVRATHRHCHVEFQGPVYVGPGFELEIPGSGTLIVGPEVKFRRGFVCEISGNGSVVIGARTDFTSHCLIQCSTSIEIGERCAFGQSTLIFDGRHRYLGRDEHWLDQGWDFQPIRIGDGVGVSDKCTIQADIGERALIASHSVVNRPIPGHCVAAGVPARVVRHFGPEDQRPGPDLSAVV